MTSMLACVKPCLAEPHRRRVVALLEADRAAAHQLGAAQTPGVLDERLDQHAADAAAAQRRLDARVDERLVDVVLEAHHDDPAADHLLAVEDADRVGLLARELLTQGDRLLVVGLEAVPGTTVLHLGPPADLVEAAHLRVVVDVDRPRLEPAHASLRTNCGVTA